MKNIISKIALASTLLGGSILGLSTPSSAGTCWFEYDKGTLSPEYCWHRVRVNANGDTVTDVRTTAGTKFTMIFWEDGQVELLYTSDYPKRVVGEWYRDKQGDIRIVDQSGWQMGFSTQNPN